MVPSEHCTDLLVGQAIVAFPNRLLPWGWFIRRTFASSSVALAISYSSWHANASL
jgi:hypothetical protein